MKNNKKVILAFGLVLGCGGIFNNVWAMEQTPFYEIFAKKKLNKSIERIKRRIEKSERTRKSMGLAKLDPEELMYDKKEKELFSNPKKYYLELVEKYKKYENNLDKIKYLPEASIWGGINYAMTLEEMKQQTKRIFDKMKKNGSIISKNAFEEIKDNYYLTPRTTKDFTRIWGNEYLKSKIKASDYLSKTYAVPHYIIVLDDPYMAVTLSFMGKLFPIVRDLKNGDIYFEKITGSFLQPWDESLVTGDIGIQSGIGYDDFSDPGNIIKPYRIGKYYIIDTEFKSFDIPIDDDLKEILEYAYERFKYLNHEKDYETYEFDL